MTVAQAHEASQRRGGSETPALPKNRLWPKNFVRKFGFLRRSIYATRGSTVTPAAEVTFVRECHAMHPLGHDPQTRRRGAGPAFFPGGSGGAPFFIHIQQAGPWDFDTCL